MTSWALGRFLVIAIPLVGVASFASERQSTIRSALEKFGFEPALSVAGAPDLDEPLSSSDFGASNGIFVAAYYFKRELEGQLLGPLHISAFHKNTGQWVHADNLNASGSVLDVEVTERYIFVQLHHTPSAGAALVLDSQSLALVVALEGFHPRRLASGEILFAANMPHFAPIHQERLILYNPRDRSELELFPGETRSMIARDYQRLVVKTYAALPDDVRSELSAGYGPVDDFDRSIHHVVVSNDGRRVAFFVGYESARLYERLPGASAIGRCFRQPSGAWNCEEYEFEQAATLTGVKVRRGSDGAYGRGEIESVVDRIAELR